MKIKPEIIRYSEAKLIEMESFDILAEMREIGIKSIPLEILPHGKCKIVGSKRIQHLNWKRE